jgi:hypothetical protein
MPNYDLPQNERPSHTTDVTFSDQEGPPGWSRNADGGWVQDDAKASDQPAEVSTGRSVAPTEASKPEQPKSVEKVEEKPQSYVWLSDGSVLRANDEDLPGASGSQNPFGHWQRDGKVFEIVGVYPTETDAGE